MKVTLEWATPDAGKRIGWIARVSNPNAKPDDPVAKLIGYLIRNKHWSPFEMANICVRIETTRDISRQLIRHRSLHFQEFSQRYAEAVSDPDFSECRMQDTKNRQNSLPCTDPLIANSWVFWQNKVWDVCWAAYKACLALGIAKEVARKLLPEGLTRTYMFVNGTVRDWYHYINVRTDPTTQKEHRELAEAITQVCTEACPEVFGEPTTRTLSELV